VRISIISFLISLIAISAVFSPPSNADDINMFLDFARFRYDENRTYLEIYYLVDYFGKDSLVSSKNIWLEFKLTDVEKDSVVASSSQEVALEGENLMDHATASVKGGLIKVVLPVGKYLLQMIRMDENKSQGLDSIEYEFTAPQFRADKIAVSDIELGSNIITRSKNEKGLFYKNTLEVFPNPARVFGKENPVLFYYIELYNLQDGDTPGDINIRAVISDKEGQIRAEKSYTRKRGSKSLVECGQFNVSRFEGGLYTLIFAVVDSASDYSVYTRNNFYIINPDIVMITEEDQTEGFSESEFFYLPEDELDKKFNAVKYIATKNEMDVHKRLNTSESKRKFLYEFWRAEQRDGLKDGYYERVDIANDLYAYSNRKGWESDRGRVYIVYGEPDRMVKKPQNPDGRPYEVWVYYDLEGGVKFFFVDETGFGDYRLLTSTKRGEIYDPKYNEMLKREEWK